MSYLAHLGIAGWHPTEYKGCEIMYYQVHSGDWYDNIPDDMKRLVMSLPNLIPVRHPHDTLVSFLSREKSFELHTHCWKSMIRKLDHINYHLVDVKQPPEYRLEELQKILSYLSIETAENSAKTKEFVETKWRLLGSHDSEIKSTYKQSGLLPPGYDYSKLNFATHWYGEHCREVAEGRRNRTPGASALH